MNKRESLLIILIVCFLTILGSIFIGLGIGCLTGKLLECVLTSVGIGLLAISVYLSKVYAEY